MCQKIVRLFLDLQNDIVRKTFSTKLEELVRTVEEKGEQYTFAKAITHLMYKHITGHHLDVAEVDAFADKLPPYQTILAKFWELIDTNQTQIICACDFVPALVDGPTMDIKTFYEKMMQQRGKPITASQTDGAVDDVNKRTFYLALLHMVILNKTDKSDKPQKIVKL